MGLGTQNRRLGVIGNLTEAVASFEQSRLRNQTIFDSSITPQEKNLKGQFATPPGLASEIGRYVWEIWKSRGEKIRLLEPAFGTGSFYSSLLRIIPSSSWERALAIEIDSDLVKISKKIWSEHAVEIRKGEFTQMLPPKTNREKFNL